MGDLDGCCVLHVLSRLRPSSAFASPVPWAMATLWTLAVQYHCRSAAALKVCMVTGPSCLSVNASICPITLHLFSPFVQVFDLRLIMLPLLPTVFRDAIVGSTFTLVYIPYFTYIKIKHSFRFVYLYHYPYYLVSLSGLSIIASSCVALPSLANCY